MMVPDLFTVGNHLWQSTAFAAAAWLLTLLLRKNSARVRHAIWFAASVKFLVPISGLIALGSRIHWSSVPVAQPAVSLAIVQISEPFSVVAPLHVTSAHAVNPLPMVFWGIWMVGILGIAASWMMRYRRIRSIGRAASSLPLDLPVRAMLSSSTMEPGVFGIFRPVLLLPEGIFERLTDSQLSAVIEHELCHVRHRDNLAASIQMFVETVFWFHPLVWWIGKRMIAERELGCDEEVLRRGNVRVSYAEGILNVCRLYAESPLVCASGVTGADLKQRIQAIISGRAPVTMTRARKAGLAAAGLIALAGPLLIGMVRTSSVHAQQTSKEQAPSFEVAAIHPVEAQDGPTSINAFDGGLLQVHNASARFLILAAYRIQKDGMAGGPDWLDNARFEIDAKTGHPGKIPENQIGPLLQSLLADRFHLRTHRETRESPVYALVPDKGGLKMKPSSDGAQTNMNWSRGPGSVQLTGTGVTMQSLAASLGLPLERVVLDQTGLTGSYDVSLKWASEQTADLALPSLFVALQEQLGLRLESRKAPVEILVIDNMEKPSGN